MRWQIRCRETLIKVLGKDQQSVRIEPKRNPAGKHKLDLRAVGRGGGGDGSSTKFEFVLTPAPELDGAASDERAFSEHLNCGDDGVAAFDNLGGDARLVAPCNILGPGQRDGYAHAAAFFTRAPDHQRSALLRASAREALASAELADGAPKWLSTSGLGVFWLHVRIDSRPKYYVHREYSSWPHRPPKR